MNIALAIALLVSLLTCIVLALKGSAYAATLDDLEGSVRHLHAALGKLRLGQKLDADERKVVAYHIGEQNLARLEGGAK